MPHRFFQPVDHHPIPPGEDPAAGTEENRAIAEHKDKRRDEKRDRQKQQKRLGTERQAHERVASARREHEEKRHLVEVREHRVEARPLHDLLDLRVERQLEEAEVEREQPQHDSERGRRAASS